MVALKIVNGFRVSMIFGINFVKRNIYIRHVRNPVEDGTADKLIFDDSHTVIYVQRSDLCSRCFPFFKGLEEGRKGVE